MKNKEDLKNVIYQLVTGTRNLAEYPAEESRYVENAFAEGEPCAVGTRRSMKPETGYANAWGWKPIPMWIR